MTTFKVGDLIQLHGLSMFLYESGDPDNTGEGWGFWWIPPETSLGMILKIEPKAYCVLVKDQKGHIFFQTLETDTKWVTKV